MYVQIEKNKRHNNRSIQEEIKQIKRHAKKGKKLLTRTLKEPLTMQRAYLGDEEAARNAVALAMTVPPQTVNYALAYHPPSDTEQWQYTRTVSCTVIVPGNPPVEVRGHIHYNGGNAGPGNMWISGIADSSFKTPEAIVHQHNGAPNLAERIAAVEYFNHHHQGSGIPLPVA